MIETLAEFRRKAGPDPAGIPIPIRGVKQAILKTTLAGLPAGIELAPARLTISFRRSANEFGKLTSEKRVFTRQKPGYESL